MPSNRGTPFARHAADPPLHATGPLRARRAAWMTALVAAMALAALSAFADTPAIVVEDWSKHPPGKRGIPGRLEVADLGQPQVRLHHRDGGQRPGAPHAERGGQLEHQP